MLCSCGLIISGSTLSSLSWKTLPIRPHAGNEGGHMHAEPGFFTGVLSGSVMSPLIKEGPAIYRDHPSHVRIEPFVYFKMAKIVLLT